MKLRSDLPAILSVFLQNENLLHTLQCYKEQLTLLIKINSRTHNKVMFSVISSIVSVTMTELDDNDDSMLVVMTVPMMVTEMWWCFWRWVCLWG